MDELIGPCAGGLVEVVAGLAQMLFGFVLTGAHGGYFTKNTLEDQRFPGELSSRRRQPI
jgi:hypothetical protein